jgi:pyruvate dehydrogenase E2 component (dihydrolipoamide acetyltransferase)
MRVRTVAGEAFHVMSQKRLVAPIAVRHPGGPGVPLLLIHGFGADHRTFAANQPVLSDENDVWMVDLPGHGDSGPDVGDGSVTTLTRAVAAALDSNGLRKVHVVGHSFGGAVATRLYHLRSDLVRSLTLLSPGGFVADVDESFVLSYPMLEDADTAQWLLQRLVTRPGLINKTMIATVLAELEKPDRRLALKRIAVAMRGMHGEMLPAYNIVKLHDVPRLMIWGEADRINPIDVAAIEAFGGASAVLEGIGHLPHAEAAVEVNRLISAFLARQDA